MTRRQSLSWILTFAALALSPTAALGGELVRGKIFVYELDKPAKKPSVGTTKVLFDFDNTSVSGPPEGNPDQHGFWREEFDLIGGQPVSVTISPQWIGDEAQTHIAHPVRRTVKIPGVPKQVHLNLWAPKRLSQDLGARAALKSQAIREEYHCAKKKTNEAIARCWKKEAAVDQKSARSEAEKAADLFEEAYSHHARQSLLWGLGNLQITVADFCKAAEAHSRIVLKEGTWTLPVGRSYIPVYESDARLQCARGSADPAERRELIAATIAQAEKATKALTQGGIEERRRARRILGNWLIALRMLSDNPDDDLKVARSLIADEGANQLWTAFRNATDGLYSNLDFQDPETSEYIVAHRITEISKRLHSSELPKAPTGIGGDG